MRVVRIGVGLALVLLSMCFEATPQEQKLTVTGKLIRAMAIGGESTGWAIQLESAISVGGKQVDSIEVASHETNKLEKLENKRVRATGRLSQRDGVETGNRSILEVSTIREVQGKPAPQAAPSPTAALSLTGSQWLLEDLGGSGVIDNVQATLTFSEADKVSGNGSCNRFFGSAKIEGDLIQLGPLGVTRMACPEAVMNQEAKYLNALQATERFEWKDSSLLLHCKGLEKPLRFTRKGP